MSTSRVFGLDLSLTRTGLALPDGTTVTLTPPTKFGRGMIRLAWIRRQILDAIGNDAAATIVAVEGYAYARANQAHQLGELGGVIRYALWHYGIVNVDIPPASLKKYATGSGGAGKEEVLAAAIRRLGYEGHDNNEADALWLRAIALDAYSAPVCDFPTKKLAEARSAALAKITWPRIDPPPGAEPPTTPKQAPFPATDEVAFSQTTEPHCRNSSTEISTGCGEAR